MAVQHTLSVLPSEILTKISSSLSIQDLARSYSIHVSWAKHVEDKLLEYINDELRVVVFDDGCQTTLRLASICWISKRSCFLQRGQLYGLS